MNVSVEINEGRYEVRWKGEVVGVITSRDAGEELREAMWLLPHLGTVALQCVKILQDLEHVGIRTEASRFVLDVNFLIQLLERNQLIRKS